VYIVACLKKVADLSKAAYTAVNPLLAPQSAKTELKAAYTAVNTKGWCSASDYLLKATYTAVNAGV